MAKVRSVYPVTDQVGNRYGKLVVKSFSHFKDSGRNRVEYWNCICDCGNYKVMSRACFYGTKSCGCLSRETYRRISANIEENHQAARSLYSSYKHDALKKRKLEFDITFDEFHRLTSQNCYLCGKEPSNIQKPTGKHYPHIKNYVYNGIDRYDNSIGYILSNCRPCCTRCNIMKTNMAIGEFVAHLRKIVVNIEEYDTMM